MTVSAISQLGQVDPARYAATFANGPDLYVLWVADMGTGQRAAAWRRQQDAAPQDVTGARLAPYVTPSAVVGLDGVLYVAYADRAAADSRLFVVGFNAVTGATLLPPVFVGPGAKPTLFRLLGAALGRLTLVYLWRGATYTAESYDGGVSWSAGRPTLNSKVRDVESVVAAPFDATHFSIMQLGTDARQLIMLGALDRSRPVTTLRTSLASPSIVLAVEASQRGAALTDTLRGAAEWIPGVGAAVATRVRQGSDDATGDFATYDMTSGVPVRTTTQVVSPGVTPGNGMAINGIGVPVEGLFTSGAVIGMAAYNGHLYVTGCDDVGGGGLSVVRLSDNAVSHPTAVEGHAVTVAIPPNTAPANTTLLFAYGDAGGQKLGLGPAASLLAADFLLPQWNRGVHAMPGKVNCLVATSSSPGAGTVYVGLADRLNVYSFNGWDRPIRLGLSIPVLTRGRVLRIAITPRGNMVCALGEGGVAVFSPNGETLAQVLPPGRFVAPWMPSAVYAGGAFVTPTAQNAYTGARTYFRCTVGGATGPSEPAWAPAGNTVIDGAAQWVEQASTLAIVTDVAVDPVLGRLYATAVLNGPTGTASRIYVYSAPGMMG